MSTESIGSAFPHILNELTDTALSPPEMNVVVHVVLSFKVQLGVHIDLLFP